MIKELINKKYIFFDVGYTLEKPASGDWVFINKFYEVLNYRLKDIDLDRLKKARNNALVYIEKNHLIKSREEQYEQFLIYYRMILDDLNINYTLKEVETIAYDRVYNMNNYIAYNDTKKVISTLSKDYKLGIISDTWPDIVDQLKHIGVYDYFTTYTYSYNLGVFKPDKMMYLDALSKMKCKGEEAVFIDDRIENLQGAEKFGITPILIDTERKIDTKIKYLKIHSLSELIQ